MTASRMTPEELAEVRADLDLGYLISAEKGEALLAHIDALEAERAYTLDAFYCECENIAESIRLKPEIISGDPDDPLTLRGVWEIACEHVSDAIQAKRLVHHNAVAVHRATIRNAALEEAAALFDDDSYYGKKVVARIIRSLKTKEGETR